MAEQGVLEDLQVCRAVLEQKHTMQHVCSSAVLPTRRAVAYASLRHVLQDAEPTWSRWLSCSSNRRRQSAQGCSSCCRQLWLGGNRHRLKLMLWGLQCQEQSSAIQPPCGKSCTLTATGEQPGIAVHAGAACMQLRGLQQAWFVPEVHLQRMGIVHTYVGRAPGAGPSALLPGPCAYNPCILYTSSTQALRVRLLACCDAAAASTDAAKSRQYV